MKTTRNYRDFLARTSTALTHADDRLRLFAAAYVDYKAEQQKSLTVLDIACGKRAVLSTFVSTEDEYWGCDFYDELDVEVPHYVQIDLNEERLTEKVRRDEFDVIFCGEILEHLFSPDALLDETKSLMHEDSILVLSTPNLSYYVNRILLLAGLSPLYLENSAEVKLGRGFSFLGQGNQTEGHIRLFTFRALRDLVRRKGLEIVRVTPTITWDFWLDRLVCRVSRSLAPNNVFVLKRTPANGAS